MFNCRKTSYGVEIRGYGTSYEFIYGKWTITAAGQNITITDGSVAQIARTNASEFLDDSGVAIGSASAVIDFIGSAPTIDTVTTPEKQKLNDLAEIKAVGAGLELDVNGDVKLTQANIDTLSDVDNKVDKVAGKGLSTEDFTTAQKDKLANIQERFLGIFADGTARDAAYPSPLNGQYCKQENTGSFWFYGAGAWVDTGSNSTGDMLASLYDPQEIAADVFDRANHTGEQPQSSVSGLEASITKLNTLDSDVRNPVGGLQFKILRNEAAIGDMNSGLTKQVYANQAIIGMDENGGLRGKVNRLVGGDIFEHDPTTVYKHGQQAYYGDASGNIFIIRANSNIDGTIADIDVVEGTDGERNTWTKIASLSGDSGGDNSIQQAHFVLGSSTDNQYTDAFTHNGFKFEVRNFMTSATKVRFTKERTENIITIWKSTSGSITASNTTEFGVINWSGHADTESLRYINVTVCDKDSNKVLHKYDITTADIANSGNGQMSISIVSQAFS